MNYLDAIILIPLLWGAYKGITKGFIISIASLVALMLGIYGAIHFSDFTAAFLSKYLNLTGEYTPVVTFAITFIGIVVLVHLVARLLDKLVEAVSMGWANKLAGAAFSVLKFGFIVSVILVVIERFNSKMDFIPKQTTEKSLLYQPVQHLSLLVFKKLNFDIDEQLERTNPIKVDHIISTVSEEEE